jgi:hypothetical protein
MLNRKKMAVPIDGQMSLTGDDSKWGLVSGYFIPIHWTNLEPFLIAAAEANLGGWHEQRATDWDRSYKSVFTW